MVLVKLTLLLFILPWSFFLFESTLIVILLSCSWQNSQTGNYPTSKLCASASSGLSRIVFWQTPYVLGLNPVLDSLGYPPAVLAPIAYRISDTLYWSSHSANLLTSLVSPLFTSSLPPVTMDPASVQLGLSRLTDSLNLLQSQLVHSSVKSTIKPQLLSPVTDRLTRAKLVVAQLLVLFPDIPRFLLSPEPVTYLVVFLNPATLRPSGGVVSQLAFVSLRAGRITSLEFRDPSNLDSRLLGRLVPPPEVQEHLKVTTWQTRDLAWDPDILSSANQFFAQVDTALSRQVAGVVFVNLDTVVKLLEITAPASAGTFYSTLSAQSSTSQSEAHYLFTVFQALLARLPSLSQAQSTRVIRVLFSSFATRQSFFVPSATSSRVSQIGWDGKLALPSCNSLSCALDYLYLVDSTAAGAVTDHQITKTIAVKTHLSTTSISTKLIITYRHSGKTGDYHSLVRLYLPFAKEIIQAPGNSAIKQLASLNEISLPLNLGPESTSEATLAYVQKIPPRQSFRYQLDIPNQPGSRTNLSVDLTYPSGWQTSSSLQPSFASPGQVLYNKPLSQPFHLSLDITTK